MAGFGTAAFGASPFGGATVVPVGGGSTTGSGLWTNPYRSGGYALWYSVDATRGGEVVANDLRPVGGQITDTTKPGVRRTLSLDLAPEPGLFDVLAPTGTTLTATAHVRDMGRNTVDVPMGVYDVDQQSLTEGGGKLSLTAPDKWQKIVRARFIGPAASTPGWRVTDQITALIQGALGASEEVVVTASSTATVGALTWEKDRDKAILDLAAGIGAWVFFDRDGVATVADAPVFGMSADWLVDASPTGVLLSLERQRSRTSTYNVIVVTSSASSGAAFPQQVVWDSDPNSDTYAGPDPVNHPELAGPFGVSVYYFDTPLVMDAGSAYRTGLSILAQTIGRNAAVTLTMAPNPSVDAGRVINVLPTRERYDLPRLMERHMCDTVTHPLVLDGSGGLHIDGRSTRTDAYS